MLMCKIAYACVSDDVATGLTADLKPAPDFTLASTAPIGSFTYIEPVKQAKKEEKRAAITAVHKHQD